MNVPFGRLDLAAQCHCPASHRFSTTLLNDLFV
jgi:hypothetical protein